MRTCTNCKHEYPLTKDHFQLVKTFKSKFSFYCNICNVETKKIGKDKNK